MSEEPDDSQTDRKQRLNRLLVLAAEAKPLPRGTKRTAEALFYREARLWVPLLVREYLKGKATP